MDTREPDDDPERALRCWDRAAPAYSRSRSTGPLALSSLYEPVVEELLGDVRDKRVLDAGCGDGHLARKLAARGACVSAVDGSREMVALAARHPNEGEVCYCVADLTKGLPMTRASFNLVVASMVLMDLPRIDIPIMEFARVLTPGGGFVFSMTHPCFFCSDWVHDPQGRKQHKAVNDYLTPAVQSLEFWGTTLHFHRPLSLYFDELTRQGFVVDAFKEPRPSEADIDRHPDWHHHRRIPSFIVVRAVRY